MIATILLAASLAASSVTRPEWCRAGFVCVPTTEIAADARYKIDLEEKVATLEAKSKRRLRWSIGCGPGVGFVVTEGWDARMAPIPLMCGVVYGF